MFCFLSVKQAKLSTKGVKVQLREQVTNICRQMVILALNTAYFQKNLLNEPSGCETI